MPKWLVVGAGLTGATIAERIAEEGREEVLVVDRRSHVAGTAADVVLPSGHLVQRYGPHVLHTSSQRVWSYLQRFAPWRPVCYRVCADVDGSMVPLPVGFRGMEMLLGPSFPAVREALLRRFPLGTKVTLPALLREPDPDLGLLARTVRERIFDGYTVKQWGVPVSSLSPSVISRVPVIVGDRDSYHSDRYQAVPDGGYTEMVSRMLDHPRIRVELGTSFSPALASGRRVICTGSVDGHFDYILGRLPYRSVKFDLVPSRDDFALPVAAVNYPDSRPYTRVSEPKRLTGQDIHGTVLSYEYPCSDGDPLYPVPSPGSRELFSSYGRLISSSGVIFCGRLGQYSYLDMDQAVGSALSLFRRIR